MTQQLEVKFWEVLPSLVNILRFPSKVLATPSSIFRAFSSKFWAPGSVLSENDCGQLDNERLGMEETLLFVPTLLEGGQRAGLQLGDMSPVQGLQAAGPHVGGGYRS